MIKLHAQMPYVTGVSMTLDTAQVFTTLADAMPADESQHLLTGVVEDMSAEATQDPMWHASEAISTLAAALARAAQTDGTSERAAVLLEVLQRWVFSTLPAVCARCGGHTSLRGMPGQARTESLGCMPMYQDCLLKGMISCHAGATASTPGCVPSSSLPQLCSAQAFSGKQVCAGHACLSILSI